MPFLHIKLLNSGTNALIALPFSQSKPSISNTRRGRRFQPSAHLLGALLLVPALVPVLPLPLPALRVPLRARAAVPLLVPPLLAPLLGVPFLLGRVHVLHLVVLVRGGCLAVAPPVLALLLPAAALLVALAVALLVLLAAVVVALRLGRNVGSKRCDLSFFTARDVISLCPVPPSC